MCSMTTFRMDTISSRQSTSRKGDLLRLIGHFDMEIIVSFTINYGVPGGAGAAFVRCESKIRTEVILNINAVSPID